ncbi:MAG: hypothetical protein V7609_2116 [Verrucomicrobiota bacterium]
MTPAEYSQLESISRRALQRRALTELELVVAHTVLDYSYAAGVRVARFKRFKFFCAQCGSGKNKISPALSRVEAYEIVRVDRRDGIWTMEFCADPAQWRVPIRIRPALRAQAAQVDAWLKQINAPGMEEQPELWPNEPTLDDALFEVYRENALSRSDPRIIEAQSEPDWQNREEIDRLTRQSLEESEVVPQKGTGEKGGEIASVSPVVPQKGTRPIAIGRAKSSPITGTGNRSAVAVFFEDQIGRLERAIGEEKVKAYLPWWRKHAGQDREHTNALRETLDDYSDNRAAVEMPDRWIVKTFKNKCRTIRTVAKALHLF